MASSDRFGFEWHRYSQISPYQEQYKNQFLNWIWPLKPDFFIGKKVLDAACGMGRNSFWCANFGASQVVAFDKDSRSVAAAQKNLRDFKQVEVLEADIYDLPWGNEFDFILAIGVIHHLKEALKAIAQLKKALKPGGEILLWVYSRQGFENYVKILTPIRKYLTSKIPLPLLHAFCYFLSVPLWFYLKVFNPSRPYFKQLRTFNFFHLHSIIFDQLLPEIANYFSFEEAKKLLDGFYQISVVQPPNKNGWVVRGIK
jgi:SAM-dependent methyltransferase